MQLPYLGPIRSCARNGLDPGSMHEVSNTTSGRVCKDITKRFRWKSHPRNYVVLPLSRLALYGPLASLSPGDSRQFPRRLLSPKTLLELARNGRSHYVLCAGEEDRRDNAQQTEGCAHKEPRGMLYLQTEASAM